MSKELEALKEMDEIIHQLGDILFSDEAINSAEDIILKCRHVLLDYAENRRHKEQLQNE